MSKGRVEPPLNSYYWKKIAITLAINVVSIPVIIACLFLFGLVAESPANTLKNFSGKRVVKTSDNKTATLPPHPFFASPKILHYSRLVDMFIIDVFREEFIYRGPIVLALATVFLLFKFKRKRLFYVFLWSAGLCLNFYWAYNIHRTYDELLWVPVFVAGLSWLWLVIKTNRLWPAVFCHATANLSIYFLIKIYQLF